MDECLFCKIINGEIPSEKVYEDANHIAFLDINPRNPGHTLVVPKKHYETILEMSDSEMSNIMLIVKKLAAAVKNGLKADGISLGQSNGRSAGQVIPHVHFHVIPRFNTEGPPGLESILPVKKLPNDALKQSADIIKNSMNAPSGPAGCVRAGSLIKGLPTHLDTSPSYSSPDACESQALDQVL